MRTSGHGCARVRKSRLRRKSRASRAGLPLRNRCAGHFRHGLSRSVLTSFPDRRPAGPDAPPADAAVPTVSDVVSTLFGTGCSHWFTLVAAVSGVWPRGHLPTPQTQPTRELI